MPPTRQIQIYQDGNAGLRPCATLGQPLSTDENNTFNPPLLGSSARSPLKAMRQINNFPPRSTISNVQVMLPVPQPSSFKTDSPMKQPSITGFSSRAPSKPVASMYTSFGTKSVADKENRGPHAVSDNVAEFPNPSRLYAASLKRSFSAIDVPIEAEVKKQRCEEPAITELPDPQSHPMVEDDGGKPQLSYASLIGMAILRSPERKLTLAQIYKWISDSFAHYRRAKDSGWQNSIRHNLSLNKTFIKQERPKDDPGKGNYWTIVPGCEGQFLQKDRGSRRTTTSNSNHVPKTSSRPASSEAHFAPALPTMSGRAGSLEVVQSKEPSSDATIPASDALSSADDEEVVMPPPRICLPQSSPLQDIRSSPPLLPDVRGDTPSPTSDLQLPSFNRPEQRKSGLTEMDDSGYFSCLESSVLRPYAEPTLPRLDGSIPRMKRGRAEEAIARMRSSSHEVSPSRARSYAKQPTPSLISSSPSKPFETGLMLPPLTPAVKIRAPAKPPPSISPNTNLRIHRESIRNLIGSPFRPTINNDLSYSPAFKISDDMTYAVSGDGENALDIFDGHDSNLYYRAATSSPVKESGRPSDRAQRTSNILADITGSNSKRAVFYGDPDQIESPLRAKSSHSPLQFGGAIQEPRHEDLFGLNFLDDEEPDDHSGFDITKGFSKIGSNKPSTMAGPNGSRPSLGSRSQTSQF